MPKPSSKAAFLERIARERRRWHASIAGLTDEEMLRVGVKPGWCVGDVLAHLAAWERRMVRRVAALRRGSGPRTELDTHTFNDLVFRKNQGRPLREIRRESSLSFGAAMRLINSLTEEELCDPAIQALVKANTYSHYRWASAKVRAWRRRVRTTGAPKRHSGVL